MLCKVIDIRTVTFDEESLIRSEKKLVMTILRHFGDVLVEGDTGALLMREWRTTVSKIFADDEQVLQKLLGRIHGITEVVAPGVTVLSSIVEFLNEAAENIRGDLNYAKILSVLENEPILIRRPEFHMLSPKDGQTLLPHQLLLLRFNELFGGLYSNSFMAGIGQVQLYKLNTYIP